jgi:predicted TIM-barrel fold metal-dependent hydrolase
MVDFSGEEESAMNRREILLGVAVAAVDALPLFQPALAEVPARIIDAHCHIFNADDLPIVEFVEKAIISNDSAYREQFRKFGEAADFFIRYLADWLRGKAFSAHDELKYLDAVAINSGAARSSADIREREIEHLTDLTAKLKDLRISGRRVRLGQRIFGAYVPGIVIGLMHREAFPHRFRGEGIHDNSDRAFTPSEWEDSGLLARQVYDEGKGPVSRYFRWGLRLTRYRSELADEIGRIHGNRATLITPALIDYSNWLDDPYDVKLADQVNVMGRLARRPGSLRVHGFAPFDPLREALHRIAPRPGAEAPLMLAKRAIQEQAFVGIKLYPPMGFKPLLNSQFATRDFPRHIHRAFRGRNIGNDLDAVLRELYAWCVAEQVPILAHASNSNGAAPGYSARANPDFWVPVVREFPGLHIALAHFGDFDEGFATDAHPRPRLSETWEWKMAKLINDHPNSLVFADLSYFRSAMLESSNNRRREIVRMFKGVLADQPLLSKRLIYGSDWIMLGQEEQFPNFASGGRYAERVDDLLRELDLPQTDRVATMFSNPAHYLGINNVQPPGSNRVRLKQFYERHGISAAWLDGLTI